MRRFALIIAVLAAALALGAAPAHAASSGVKLLGCESSLDPAGRAATFEGRMRTKKSARAAADALHAADAHARGAALARAAGRRLRQVADAATRASAATSTRSASSRCSRPASYRTIVRFRWLDADGERVASSRSTSATCRQADLRPNLRPLGVEARAGADAAHARYVVPVVNRGRSLAGPFDVVVSVDDTTLTPAQAPELQPGERALVEVQGPPCAGGQMLTVDVDPTGAVDERTEADNQLSVPCPGAPA